MVGTTYPVRFQKLVESLQSMPSDIRSFMKHALQHMANALMEAVSEKTVMHHFHTTGQFSEEP